MAYRSRTVYPDVIYSETPQHWYEDDAQHFDCYDRNTWYTRPETRFARSRSAGPAFAEHDTNHRSRGRSDTRYSSPRAQFTRSSSLEPRLSDYDDYYESCGCINARRNRRSRSKKYWARPVDGKRRGTLGRLLDGLIGEGPDVFVVLTGSRRSLHRDMPHRAQWSGWEGSLDDHGRCRSEGPGHSRSEPDHFERNGARRRGKYNFQTRKYESAARMDPNRRNENLWTDAYWSEGARRGDMNPSMFRDGRGQWWTDVSRDSSRASRRSHITV